MNFFKLLIVLLLTCSLVACAKNDGNQPSTETPSPNITEKPETQILDLVYSHTLELDEYLTPCQFTLETSALIQEDNKTIIVSACDPYLDDNSNAFVNLITLEDFKVVDSKKVHVNIERIISASLEDEIITIVGSNYSNPDKERNLTRIATITTSGEMISNNRIISKHGKTQITNAVTINNITYGIGSNLMDSDGPPDSYFMSINLDGTVNYEKTAQDFGYNDNYSILNSFVTDEYYFLYIVNDHGAPQQDQQSDNNFIILALDSNLDIKTEIKIDNLKHYNSLNYLSIIDVTSTGYSLYYSVGNLYLFIENEIKETKRVDYNFEGEIINEISIDSSYKHLKRLTDQYILSEYSSEDSSGEMLYYLLDNKLNVLEQMTFNDGEYYSLRPLNENSVLRFWDNDDYPKTNIDIYNIVTK